MIHNRVSSQLSNTCCVRRYATCVPGYTSVSVGIQHLFVVTQDAAVGTQLKQLCMYTQHMSLDTQMIVMAEFVTVSHT